MVNQYKGKIRRFDCAVKIVILDDELEFSKILDKKIKEYCARKDLLYDCQIFSSSKNLLEDDLSSIQVAFLDIDMPEINGLDVAKVLHQRYPEMILVFVTSFIKYAPSGYKVNAFRYLLKTQLDARFTARSMACAAFLIFLLLMSRTIEYSVRIMTENFIILQVKFWGTSTTDIPALFRLNNFTHGKFCSGRIFNNGL